MGSDGNKLGPSVALATEGFFCRIVPHCSRRSRAKDGSSGLPHIHRQDWDSGKDLVRNCILAFSSNSRLTSQKAESDSRGDTPVRGSNVGASDFAISLKQVDPKVHVGMSHRELAVVGG